MDVYTWVLCAAGKNPDGTIWVDEYHHTDINATLRDAVEIHEPEVKKRGGAFNFAERFHGERIPEHFGPEPGSGL